jgi:hypothetical protein
MCEAVSFFEQALAEEGITGDVTHESDDCTDTFYTTKDIGTDTLTVTTNIDNSYTWDMPKEKRIAMAARNVSDKFQEFLTERFEWGGRCVEVLPYDEPEARCAVCGARVELPPRSKLFAQSAELSAPHPTPVEEQTVLDSLDDHSRVLLKMFLLGKLREACKPYCDNSS